MKNRKIPLSLYILVPLIFGGISLISALVSHYLTIYYLKGAPGSQLVFFLGIVALLLITLACSFLVLSQVIKPVMKFVKDSEKLPIMPPSAEEFPGRAKARPEYYAQVFAQVTDLLGKVEARELFPRIIGQSQVMRHLFGQMLKVAPTDTTVLITGESGTGKELVAEALHEHSLRKEGALIKINCVAIPEGLLESELFGHERGAFTGAVAQKKGKFELAHGGTIFLDEIGDMPLPTQAKLLRVLQEKEIERVGGVRSLRVDVRFIAATNRDIEELVRKGQFREDLFFRLNVFPLAVPPLRARREDILLLCQRFLAGHAATEIAPRALQWLLGHSWPGNVRELKNVIERAAVLADRGVIEYFHLPAGINPDWSGPEAALGAGANLDERLRALERGLIIEALNRAGGVQARAADLLGVNQRSLWHRVKKLGIDVSSLKKPPDP